jgi:hypothetical protein
MESALVTYGPLATAMYVYSDFYNYAGGVYQYTSGTLQGGHVVLIVGFDHANQYFIAKNAGVRTSLRKPSSFTEEASPPKTSKVSSLKLT